MYVSTCLWVYVQVPTEAREGIELLEQELQVAVLWVRETELRCFVGPVKHSIISLAQQILMNLLESLEYCPNFVYLPYTCNSIFKSMLEENNKTCIKIKGEKFYNQIKV